MRLAWPATAAQFEAQESGITALPAVLYFRQDRKRPRNRNRVSPYEKCLCGTRITWHYGSGLRGKNPVSDASAIVKGNEKMNEQEKWQAVLARDSE
ncbi:MAG: hypothetical protein KDH08_04735, partial [Anaerolineae bacterium]|nr:hypothetical protein [Anaerolineae bacterium]